MKALGISGFRGKPRGFAGFLGPMLLMHRRALEGLQAQPGASQTPLQHTLPSWLWLIGKTTVIIVKRKDVFECSRLKL